MKLDIRIPIGALFLTIGLILALYGAFSDSSLALNVNLWWGIVLFSFGAAMLLLSWKALHAGPKVIRPPGNGEGGEQSPP